MDLFEKKTPIKMENLLKDDPYFDFVNPKIVVDTDVKEEEGYQEYVDRMIEAYPTTWQKNMLAYYSLVTPIAMLYAHAVHEPKSVEELGIFDMTTLQQEQIKISALKDCENYDTYRSVWNNSGIKLMPDYRDKIIAKGNLCMYSYSLLNSEIEKQNKEKMAQSNVAKKTKLLNKVLGVQEGNEIFKPVNKYPVLEEVKHTLLNSWKEYFKRGNAYLTENEVLTYGKLWNVWADMQDPVHNVGIPTNVMENIQKLADTLLKT